MWCTNPWQPTHLHLVAHTKHSSRPIQTYLGQASMFTLLLLFISLCIVTSEFLIFFFLYFAVLLIQHTSIQAGSTFLSHSHFLHYLVQESHLVKRGHWRHIWKALDSLLDLDIWQIYCRCEISGLNKFSFMGGLKEIWNGERPFPPRK